MKFRLCTCIVVYWWLLLNYTCSQDISNIKPFYEEAPLNFILDFGQDFGLFLPYHGEIVSRIAGSPKLQEFYSKFQVRDYTRSIKQVGTGSSAKSHFQQYDKYVPKRTIYYNHTINNLFRFGTTNTEDRFYDIALYGNQVDFNVDSNSAGLLSNARCVFPPKETGQHRVITKLYENKWCSVPDPNNLQSSYRFDLIVGYRVVLSNITVQVDHRLDTRVFDITVATVITDIHNWLIHEWIMHNILLGVEHFYIIYNNVEVGDLTTSPLQPFLDANIVTLLWYPFTFDHNACCSMQNILYRILLKKYSRYTRKWFSFHDIDEHFFPSPDMLLTKLPLGQILPHVLNTIKSEMVKKRYGFGNFAFNTMQVGCTIKPAQGYFDVYDKWSVYFDEVRANETHAQTCLLNGTVIDNKTMGRGKVWQYSPWGLRGILHHDGLQSLYVSSTHGGVFVHFHVTMSYYFNGRDLFSEEERAYLHVHHVPDTRFRDFVMSLVNEAENIASTKSLMHLYK